MTPKEQDVKEVLDSWDVFLYEGTIRDLAIKMCDHSVYWAEEGSHIRHCEECPYVWERKPRGVRLRS